jgi:hypothetical protein
MADQVSPPSSPLSSMPDRRPPGALTPAEQLQDYLSALKTIRFAGRLFAWLVVLCLLLQVALYLTIRFWDVPALEQLLNERVATEGAGYDEAMTFWQFGLDFGLPLAHFVGVCATFLWLMACLLLANVCLSGRLGGAHGSIASFFWAVLLLAMLVPWQQIVPVTEVPSVFYSMHDLQQVSTFQSNVAVEQIVHYIRFLGYPFLALLVALACGLSARRAFRTAVGRVRV